MYARCLFISGPVLFRPLLRMPGARRHIADALKYVVETGHKMADRHDTMAHHLRSYGESESAGIRACTAAVAAAIEQVQDYNRAHVRAGPYWFTPGWGLTRGCAGAAAGGSSTKWIAGCVTRSSSIRCIARPCARRSRPAIGCATSSG